MRRVAILITAVLVALGVTLAPTGASASVGSGPPLDVPAATLAAALTCHGDPTRSTGTPVLLVPGTTLTADVNFSWNYEKVFSAAGRAWCAITLPHNAMSDIQVAGEYVVSGIRALHAAAGTRIDVLGFSQGGMVPRWALKYWPDTRSMVDDMVGIDPSNHGTLDADAICLPGCAPAFWQQRSNSAFLKALNTGPETWAGISYTQMYTATDEVVVPNIGPAASSALHTGAGSISNVLVQSICPVHVADHLTMGTFDPLAYALVLDALDHPGPARPARIPSSVCGQLIMPGLDPVSVATHMVTLAAVVAGQVALYPHTSSEPALAAYAS
jgi:hypothetical protein